MKKLFLLSFLLISLILPAAASVTVGGNVYENCFNTTITSNSGSNLTNYVVPIKAWREWGQSYGNNIFLGNAKQFNVTNSWADFIVTDSNFNVYPYVVDRWIYSTPTNGYGDPIQDEITYWVNITSINTTGTQICVLSNNMTVASASNFTTTFPAGTDFNNGTTINDASIKWTKGTGTGTGAVSSSIFTLTAGGSISQYYSDKTYGVNNSYLAWAKWGSGAGQDQVIGGVTSDAAEQISFDSLGSSAYQTRTAHSSTSTLNTVTSSNAYHLYEGKRNSSTSAIFDIDYNNVKVHTTNLPVGNLPLFVYADGSGLLYIDAMAARQYQYPEPTFSNWITNYNFKYFGLGDSLVMGTYGTESYIGVMAKQHDPTSNYGTNRGPGGHSGWGIINLSMFYPANSTQIIIIQYGRNDFVGGTDYTVCAANITKMRRYSILNGSYPIVSIPTRIAASSATEQTYYTNIQTNLTNSYIPYMIIYDSIDTTPNDGIMQQGNPTYYAADTVHPIDPGIQLMANYTWNFLDKYVNIHPEYFTSNITHNITGNSTWAEPLVDFNMNYTIYNTTGSSTGNILYTQGGIKNGWNDIRVSTPDGYNLSYKLVSNTTEFANITVKVLLIRNQTNGAQIKFWWGNATLGNGTDPAHVGAMQTVSPSPVDGIWGEPTSPVASFTSNVTGGYPSFVVQFNDTSTNIPTSWYWEFGDGSNSTAQNPTNNYSSVIGNTTTRYNVNFKANNTVGFSWSNQSNYITSYPLNASFWSNVTTQKQNAAIIFNSTYTNGTPTTFNWSFGDGSFADTQNATHSYSSVNNYTVILNISNAYSYNWSSKVNMITINSLNPPVAAFSSNVTSGYPPFGVQFTDTSSNSPTWWNWSFGDGGYSDLQSPDHSYASIIGNSIAQYTVSLNVSNVDGYNTTTQTNYITAYPLNASFTANATSGYYPTAISFTDASGNGTANNWSWNFGDGNTSFLQNPVFTYTHAGTFNVSVNVSNAYSWSWANRTNLITISPPLAPPVSSFTANQTSGYYPLPVQFNDTSSNTPTAWNWSFNNVTGNNTEVFWSTERNATNVFGIGNFSIKLNSSNADGYNISAGILFINTSAIIIPPVASFTSNVTSGYPAFVVQFTDTSLNSTAWNWSFGDGGYSNTQNAIHNYSSVIGNSIAQYTVILNATNTVGANTSTQTNYITAYPLNASFTANATSGKPPTAIQFTDASSNGTISNWSWNFGDGNGSYTQNPVFTYTYDGTFTVSINVSNAYSWDWENKTNYIVIAPLTPPVADFHANATSGIVPKVILFTDDSTNTPTSWQWNFGDGSPNSTLQNPTHNYTASGNYTVNLTAYNADGFGYKSKVNYINLGSGIIPFPGYVGIPTDPNGDGIYEDTNANTRSDFVDTSVYFVNLYWAGVNEPIFAFDFNGNGRIDYNDVAIMFDKTGV